MLNEGKLAPDVLLPFIGAIRKVSVLVDCRLSDLHNFLFRVFRYLFHLDHHPDFIQRLGVGIDSFIENFLSSLELFINTSGSDTHQQVGEGDDQNESRDEVSPNIDALIMKSKHGFEYFLGGVKVDAIAMSDGLIVFHVARGFLIMADELFFAWLRVAALILILAFLHHCTLNLLIFKFYINNLSL